MDNICNNLQWSKPQLHVLHDLHASLSEDEIRTSLSQAGWHIETGPTLIYDGRVLKMSGNWAWYHGRHVLAFRHEYWDEVLRCYACLNVVWWNLDTVLKTLLRPIVHY